MTIERDAHYETARYKKSMRWLRGEFKEGTPEELEARRIFAGVLKHGRLTLGMRVELSHLINPDRRDDMGRWLVFKRPRGNRSNLADHRNVAAVIWHEVKAGREKKAYQHAVARLGVSLRTAKAAYKFWKPYFESHASKIKDLTRIED